MINKAEYRPFNEPWHAQIFALTVLLNEQGHFKWKDWSKVFSDALTSSDAEDAIINDNDYYIVWLRTLEEFLQETGKIQSDEIVKYFNDWRIAFLNTPHGQPVNLDKLSSD